MYRSFIFILTWIFLRIFFEGVLESFHRIGYIAFSYKSILMYFVHFPFFYLSLFLILVVIISLLIKEEIKQVTTIASMGLGIILFIPILDAIIGGGYLITYPLRLEPYLLNFLNPAISLSDIGVSYGQRIVIVSICLLCSIYSFIKTKRIWNSIILFFVILATIIFWGGITTIVAGNRPEHIYVTTGILSTDTQKFSAIYGLLFIFSLFLYCYFLNRKYFKILIDSMRTERMFFYGGIGVFGFILSMYQKGITYKGDMFDPLGILILFISLSSGFWGVQVINDFFDIEADRITRGRNPLLKGMSKNYYSYWGLSLILLSLCLTLVINYYSFLIMITYILLGIVYSVPPVRLKRIPLVATFILSVAVVLSMAMGFSIFYGNRALNGIPKEILLPTLLSVTFGFAAKDIPDIRGDKTSGVFTLPVLLYKDTILGRLPMAIIIGLSYIFYIIFIPKLFYGALAFSVSTIIYTIFIKEIKEWFYFILLYLFGIYLCLTFVLS